MSLLTIEDLKVCYKTEEGNIHAVDGVSFEISESMSFGLLGESGCGKTTIAKSIMRILPPNAEVKGRILFNGANILAMDEKRFRRLRWKEIAFIPQSAMNALNPVFRIEDQILEVIRIHERGVDKQTALERIYKAFELVGLDKERIRDYPHQLSGGMKQRVLIAMALVLNPKLLIMDEPTTGLDVIVQDRILRNIIKLKDSVKCSILLITHDAATAIEICDKIAIMYAGKIVELGPTKSLFRKPHHPYTMGLKNAFPNVRLTSQELISIPGTPPYLLNPPKGCRFYERCPFASPLCRTEEPKVIKIDKDHYVACFRIDKADEFRELAKSEHTWKKRF